MAIDVHGKVGTLASSRRFKDDIKPMDKTSESILALKPVTFHYKSDKNCSSRFGLIAEEVAEVNPELVARDKDGKPYSVRYDQVNAMLLNEFLKDHKKVEAQQTKISQQQVTIAGLESKVAQQQKGMEALSDQLKEQATQIQKLTAQVEISQPASKVVADEP
jgi:cytochrome c biogenesis protein ResB